MHFSKTFAQVLSGLPADLRDHAIQYRQLKKLINQIVSELSALGLSPDLLQELLDHTRGTHDDGNTPSDKAQINIILAADGSTGSNQLHHTFPRVVYEVTGESGRLEPHLRLWVGEAPPPSASISLLTVVSDEHCAAVASEVGTDLGQDGTAPLSGLVWRVEAGSSLRELQEHLAADAGVATRCSKDDTHDQQLREIIIPLVADTLFFETLSTALEDMTAHLITVRSNFMNALQDLSRDVGTSARPSHSTSAFRAHSRLTTKPWVVYDAANAKSDLYAWREIFQLYVESEVFESMHELDRGELPVEESEQRLKLFAERVAQRGFKDGDKLKLKTSRDALVSFLQFNVFILDIKRFQHANSEAARKILKKHTKRTSLALPSSSASPLPLASQASLAHLLVQAIGETLLPVIPHLDDYSCLICTSIAFKPIRLTCGHLFCVRCLVKMQKRGKGACPMCRAECVLVANRNNVDWALLNFMQDWFPVESREKLKQNEKEAAREQAQELGFDPDEKCVVM